MDFKKLKAQRSKIKEAVSKLREEQDIPKGDKYYYPKVDKNGNANVIVRILPRKDINLHPVAAIYKHQAKEKNKNFSMICPSTFGTMKDCELCQELSDQWVAEKNSGNDHPKINGYRSKKRLVNVLVVKDKEQPEFEGKVMKMYIAMTVETKINKALFPPKAEDGTLSKPTKIIHDLWDGYNLNLDIFQNDKGYPDYSESYFDVEPTPVAKTEKKIEEIYNSIQELMPEKEKCPTSEEVKQKFYTFMGLKAGSIQDDIEKKNETKKQEKEAGKVFEEEFNCDVVNDDDEEEKEEEEKEEEEKNDDEEALPWD